MVSVWLDPEIEHVSKCPGDALTAAGPGHIATSWAQPSPLLVAAQVLEPYSDSAVSSDLEGPPGCRSESR